MILLLLLLLLPETNTILTKAGNSIFAQMGKVSNPTKYEDTCKMLFCCRAAGIDSQSLTYEKPYCRIAPYLVGMVLGYLLLHAKDWRLTSKVI